MSNSLKVETLERKDADSYAQLFDECPQALAQQSLAWSDIIAPISPDKPFFLVVRKADDQSVIGGLPLYYFEGQEGPILNSVSHAGPLGGVLSRKDLDADLRKKVYEILTNEAIQLAEELKCISLSIITNPFLNDAKLYQHKTAVDYILNNYCQVTDIQSVLDDSGNYNTGKSSYNSHIKRNIKKAYDHGVSIQWADESDFDAWYDIHHERFNEIGVYPLPKALLKGVITTLKPAGMGGLIIAKLKDKIVGGSIYIWNKEIVDVFMPSYVTSVLKQGVSYAVTDFAIKHFAQLGLKWFNFQSSYKDSGVYEYKKRWGSQEMYYQILTWTFKGFEKVLKAPMENILNMYQWHFVAPFEAIENRLTSGLFEKPTEFKYVYE